MDTSVTKMPTKGKLITERKHSHNTVVIGELKDTKGNKTLFRSKAKTNTYKNVVFGTLLKSFIEVNTETILSLSLSLNGNILQ